MSDAEETHSAEFELDESECTSLRERKKMRRRWAIHEAAIKFVEERGLDNVTVQEICDEAGVSERTFFNYFPTKAMAALGIQEMEIDEREEQIFLESKVPLIEAVCRLVVYTVNVPEDRLRLKEFVTSHPELAPALWQQMGKLRQSLAGVVVQRAGSLQEARLAISIAMTAVGETVHDGKALNRKDLLVEMLRIVDSIRVLATTSATDD